MSSLEQAFQRACEELHSLPAGVYLPEKTKLRLFGLQSYVLNGTNLPPVSVNDLIGNKAEALKRKAWRDALKLTKQQAMEEFCEIVNELSRTRKSGVKLSGHLYRRDNKSSWKPCYVELKERVIYYYDDSELSSMVSLSESLLKDNMRNYPSGLLFLMDGFVVSTETFQGAKAPSGEPLFCFSIAHPKSHKVFALGCASREELQHWVDSIRLESVRKSTSYETLAAAKQGGGIPPELESTFENKSFLLSGNHAARDFGVPAAYSFITDDAVSNFLNLISDKSIWSFSNEKSGVRTFVQASGADLPGFHVEDVKHAVAVLGHAPRIQAPIRSVFELVWTTSIRRNIDTQLESWSVVEELGAQTRVDHIVYSAVWPTSKRDFCRLTHFRVDDSTGAVLVVGVSVKHIMCPPSREAVRARLFCTGFLITPLTETTCEVRYLIVVDPIISSVPRRFIVSVAASQTSILERMQSHFIEFDHLIHGGLVKGPVQNLALLTNGSGRRKRRSTTSMTTGAQFVKTAELPSVSATLGSNVKHKLVRVKFASERPEKWWLKFWFMGMACAMATIGLDTSTLHLLSLLLSSFAIVFAVNKNAYVTGILHVPVGIDRRLVAVAMQTALRNCPAVNGRYSRFGTWRPNSVPRVAVLSDLKSGTATVYLDPLDPASGDESDVFLGDAEDCAVLFVTCGLVNNHEMWSDRAVLFSSSSDHLHVSLDRRCAHELDGFLKAVTSAIEASVPRAVPSDGPSLIKQNLTGRPPLFRSDSARSTAL